LGAGLTKDRLVQGMWKQHPVRVLLILLQLVCGCGNSGKGKA
jgi:hypothetical protein